MGLGSGYSGKVNSWDVLVSSLLAKLVEWPFLLPLYNELLALIADSRVVVLQQETARAQFHEAIGKRQDLERRGTELRTRIAAHLRAQLGFRNDQLRQFGLDPLPRITRRKVEEQPTPEVTAISEAKAD
ncbi:MAG: hypothetical protein QOH06_4436 [Acidobacteriota bacterium]|jgi:hypothetical protein|nr:hypothetical protein [Acidobacteriota bacterium]